MPELNDIFNDDKKRFSDEELLKYLDGKASDEEQHEVEKKMLDSSFEKEAMEGLQQFSQKENLDNYVKQLNKNLNQQLHQKKQRKEKRKIKDLPLSVIAVIIILILCLLVYVVVHLNQRTSNSSLPVGDTTIVGLKK